MLRERIVRLLLFGSLVITLVFPLVRSTNIFHTVGGGGTDLVSHWGSSILLAYEGAALYRVPSVELCEHPDGPRSWKAPELTCGVRGHPELEPFIINWQQYPRVYPPGCQLMMAPFAGLYLAGLPLPSVNAVAMVVLLIFTHLATYQFGRIFWRHERRAVRILGLTFVVFAHLQFVTWALNGMYDPIALIAMFAAIGRLREHRFASAFTALSLAFFLHYRALWYLPLFAWVAMQTLASWRTLSPREKWAVVAAACGPALAAITFVLSWPAFEKFPVTNPLFAAPALVTCFVPVVVIGVLALAREGLTFSCAVWQLLLLRQTHEVRAWHVLFSTVLVAVATLGRRATLAVCCAIVLVLWQSERVFNTGFFSAEQLLNLFAE